MLHRIFALDTTFYHFATMVERLISIRKFQTGWGPVTLRSRRQLGEWGHFLKVWIWEEDSQPDFSFEVNLVSPDRISVTATCNNVPYEPTFDELLTAIETQWGTPLWPRPETSPAPAAQAKADKDPTRGMNIGTPLRVAQAALLIEQDGAAKKVACQLAGVDLKTYNRWRDDPEVLKAIERQRIEFED